MKFRTHTEIVSLSPLPVQMFGRNNLPRLLPDTEIPSPFPDEEVARPIVREIIEVLRLGDDYWVSYGSIFGDGGEEDRLVTLGTVVCNKMWKC